MQAAIYEEQLGSDGEKTSKYRDRHPRRSRATTSKRRRVTAPSTAVGEDDSDADDSDFDDSGSGSESDSSLGSDSEIIELTNAEVCAVYYSLTVITLTSTLPYFQLADVLPTKIVSAPSKKRRLRARVETVEDQDSPRRLSARSQSPVNPDVIIEPAPQPQTSASKVRPLPSFLA